jgi:phospholipase C
VFTLALMVVAPACLPIPGALPGTDLPAAGPRHLQTLWAPSSTHIQHVITVVMENRGYDNYFGEYCLTLGPYCPSTGNGIPVGTCVPNDPANPSLGCTPPFNFSSLQLATADMPHDWASGRAAWDNGSMDGFFQAGARGILPFGHYNATTLAIYWEMAQRYAISDNLFAGNLSYSLPNHWDLIAGQAPEISEQSYLRTGADRTTYLNESNSMSTIQDLLNGTSISWKYYDFDLAPRSLAVQPGGSAYDYWNPMAARAESYSSAYASHFVGRDTFLTDIQAGGLPELSWIIPSENASEHPGFNITWGESWVAQLVNLVEGSAEWASTAIFIVWDDYGGWYDHVPPPRVYSGLLSFRSPAIVISPYAKQNYISHQFLDFYSLLRYDGWQFGLGCLTVLDCTAPMPFDFFDFNQTARPPMMFPTVWDQAVYPIAEPGDYGSIGGDLRLPPCLSCVAVDPQFWSAYSPRTTVSHLGD